MTMSVVTRVALAGALASAFALSWTAASARAPEEQYAQFGTTDESVRDHQTGLTWQRSVSTPYRTWSQANAYCATLTIDRAGGFRLPTYKELLTLVDESCRSVFENGRFVTSCIDFNAFPDTPINLAFWTATPSPAGASRYFSVEFSTGESLVLQDGFPLAVRCVK